MRWLLGRSEGGPFVDLSTYAQFSILAFCPSQSGVGAAVMHASVCLTFFPHRFLATLFCFSVQWSSVIHLSYLCSSFIIHFWLVAAFSLFAFRLVLSIDTRPLVLSQSKQKSRTKETRRSIHSLTNSFPIPFHFKSFRSPIIFCDLFYHSIFIPYFFNR